MPLMPIVWFVRGALGVRCVVDASILVDERLVGDDHAIAMCREGIWYTSRGSLDGRVLMADVPGGLEEVLARAGERHGGILSFG